MAVSVITKAAAYPPGESIYELGDGCNCMYVIMQGLLRQVTGSQDLAVSRNFKILQSGDYFGSDIFIQREVQRTDCVKSMTYVAVYELTKEDIWKVLTEKGHTFKETVSLIKRHAMARALRRYFQRIGFLIIEEKVKLGLPRLSFMTMLAMSKAFRKTCNHRRNLHTEEQKAINEKLAQTAEYQRVVKKDKELLKLTGIANVLTDAIGVKSLRTIAENLVAPSRRNSSEVLVPKGRSAAGRSEVLLYNIGEGEVEFGVNSKLHLNLTKRKQDMDS